MFLVQGAKVILFTKLEKLKELKKLKTNGLAGDGLRQGNRRLSAGRKAAFGNMLAVRPLRGRLPGLPGLVGLIGLTSQASLAQNYLIL